MKIIRMWILSTLAVLMFCAVAWSFFILFFQVAFSSLTRAERPLTAAFGPVHVGYENHSVSLPKPGIPFEPNRSRSIAGKDLDQWLLQPRDLKTANRVSREAPVAGCVRSSLDLSEAPLLSPQTDHMPPVDSTASGFVVVFFAIPAVHTGLCSP